MFTIPDKGEGVSNIQSILFQEQLEILVAAIDGKDCVLSGGVVTAQGTPDMTVAVAKCGVLTNAVLKAVAGANGTITTADGSNPRLDLVVISSSGSIAVRAGAAAAAPQPPNRTANDVVLAIVYVAAGVTSITSDRITDMRMLRSVGSITIDKVTAAVTFNTTLAIQTLYSLTLPSGLLLSGKSLRVRAGGTWLSNSGTPTWTWTLSYGGTVMFAGATTATTADTDRAVWMMDVLLQAQSSTVQKLTGLFDAGRTAAKTPPTTGTGGWAGSANANGIAGTAAVDSDAADRVFTLQVTMSVSNVNVETVMDYATASLE